MRQSAISFVAILLAITIVLVSTNHTNATGHVFKISDETCINGKKRMELRERVYNLTVTYDKSVPLFKNDTQLSAYSWISSIAEANENANTITIIGGLTISLDKIPIETWKAADYCNINRFIVPQELIDRIWSPRYESSYIYDRRQINADVMYIWENGYMEIELFGMSVISLLCDFDTLYYPLDTQLCSWQISLFDGLESMPLDPKVFCTFYNGKDMHPTWQLLSCSAQYDVVDSGSSIEATFHILMSRRSLYAMITVVLPTIVLANCNPVIFLLPHNYPQKVTVGMSLLLAFFIYMSALSSNQPESYPQPYFYFYLLSVLVCNCLAIVLSGLVLNIQKKEMSLKLNKWCLIGMIVVEVVLTLTLVISLNRRPEPVCYGNFNCVFKGARINMTCVETWERGCVLMHKSDKPMVPDEMAPERVQH